jgi:hypothetical protein
VQVRVLRPRGAVLVGGGDEPLAVLARDAAGAAADDAGLVLEVGERRLPGGGVGLVDGAPGLGIAERVQDADALGDGEDAVEARDRAEGLPLQAPLAAGGVDLLDRDRAGLRVPPAQLFAGVGVVAADQRPQLAILDDPFEPEREGAAAGPDAG